MVPIWVLSGYAPSRYTSKMGQSAWDGPNRFMPRGSADAMTRLRYSDAVPAQRSSRNRLSNLSKTVRCLFWNRHAPSPRSRNLTVSNYMLTICRKGFYSHRSSNFFPRGRIELEHYGVFKEDHKGPIWIAFFDDLDQAKTAASKLVRKRACGLFHLLLPEVPRSRKVQTHREQIASKFRMRRYPRTGVVRQPLEQSLQTTYTPLTQNPHISKKLEKRRDATRNAATRASAA